MIKHLLTCLIVAGSLNLFSQVGAKLMYVKPTGRFGASQKPAIGAELSFKSVDDDEPESGFQVRFGLGFAKFKSRLDTFPTYGVISGQGTTVTPGFTVIHKYNIVSLSMGVDYMIRLTDKLFLYPGTDVGVLFTSLAYDSYAPLISSEGYSGGYVFLSFRLRAGGEYWLSEQLALFAEATRSMNFSPEVGGLGYNEYGLGVRYKF